MIIAAALICVGVGGALVCSEKRSGGYGGGGGRDCTWLRTVALACSRDCAPAHVRGRFMTLFPWYAVSVVVAAAVAAAASEFGPEFLPVGVSVASTQGRKLATWQIVALSMFWWGFALWMYMFVVLMIPGQVRCWGGAPTLCLVHPYRPCQVPVVGSSSIRCPISLGPCGH